MKYLSSYKLFENVQKAKSILKSLDLDTNDDRYKKIAKILEKNLEHINDFSDILIEELNYLLIHRVPRVLRRIRIFYKKIW
jgi:hypothetical protein